MLQKLEAALGLEQFLQLPKLWRDPSGLMKAHLFLHPRPPPSDKRPMGNTSALPSPATFLRPSLFVSLGTSVFFHE